MEKNEEMPFWITVFVFIFKTNTALVQFTHGNIWLTSCVTAPCAVQADQHPASDAKQLAEIF